MDDAGIDALCHLFADLFFVQKIIQKFTGCTGTGIYKVACSIAFVGNVVIDADTGLCSIQIHHVVSEAFPVSAV